METHIKVILNQSGNSRYTHFWFKKTAKLVYGELENNLKQGPVPPWGMELLTFPMLKESSYKFFPTQRTIHEGTKGLFMNNGCQKLIILACKHTIEVKKTPLLFLNNSNIYITFSSSCKGCFGVSSSFILGNILAPAICPFS